MSDLHTNTPDEWIVGNPDTTIVYAHGRGADPESMRKLAQRLDLSDVRHLFLEADDNTWYPAGFMADFAKNEPKLSAAIAHIESVVSDLLDDGVAPESIVVGGFSQGSCLAAEYFARHPRKLGGCFVLTGGLIGPEATTWPVRTELAGMPVYLSSALNDDWVPPSRIEETKEWFEKCGVQLHYRMFEERPHSISDTEVDELRAMLEG
jgi:predicted esterase